MSAKPKQEPWFVSAFERAYLRVYAHRNAADAAMAIDSVEREVGVEGAVLDLCCGAGRHMALLEARGASATGFDLSRDLLAHARQELPNSCLVRGDARLLPFKKGAFDRVLNLFSSFGYFDDDAEHLAMLSEMARVLSPKGRLFFDHMNPAKIRAGLVPESREERDGLVIESRRSIDEDNQRVNKHVRITEGDEVFAEYTESVRLFAPSDFDALFKCAGLKITKRLGDFESNAFTENSPRQIIIAEKS